MKHNLNQRHEIATMRKLIHLMIFIVLAKSKVKLTVNSLLGNDPTNCSNYAVTACTDASPCKTLTCTLEYANATLQQDPNQNLAITLIAPENPLENNYTIGKSGQNITLWLNFTGTFTLAGNLNSNPTTESCATFPAVSLQNYKAEFLSINATGGIIFEYINFQVLLAFEPIKIYNYGFHMENICIGMSRANTINFLPGYEENEDTGGKETEEEEEEEEVELIDYEEYTENSPYKNAKYRMIMLESGGITGANKPKVDYNFSNIMITYNGTDFKYCGTSQNVIMLLYFVQCSYYYNAGLITHNTNSMTNLPSITFTNMMVNCAFSKYLKILHSKNSSEFIMNGMITNCFPAYQLSTGQVDIQNITIDNNVFGPGNKLDNIGMNANGWSPNRGAIVFDLITYGSVSIQDLIITNFDICVCLDYAICYTTLGTEPASIVSISDSNMQIPPSRLLQQQTYSRKSSNYKSAWDNQFYKDYWSSENNMAIDTIINSGNDNSDNNIRHEYRIDQEENIDLSNISPLLIPSLSLYSNLRRDIQTILNPDYIDYEIYNDIEFPDFENNIDITSSIIFKNITIFNNNIVPNIWDNFFSFIYVNAKKLTTTSGYILQDINYTNNIGINTFEHYGFTLYDGISYYINNITFISNSISRFAIIGTLIKQAPITVIMANVNISSNSFNTINDEEEEEEITNSGDPTMGIIDITSNNMSLSISISNISVIDNRLSFTRVINIKNIEIFYEFKHLFTFISNLQITNNTLTSSSLLALTGSQVYINNVTFTNNNIGSALIFDLSNQANQFNSFVLQNSTFEDNELSQSYLLQKDMGLNSALAFLETKSYRVKLPFWITISNCTFKNITLTDNSGIIEFSSMPFAFIYNNTFRNISISQKSTLFQGNNFVDSLKDNPKITNQIPSISIEHYMLDNFTSQIFQSSINLINDENIYSDLELFDENNQPLEHLFITRIAYNIFDTIYTNLSIVIQFQVCGANFMLLSIDHNSITNMNLSNYLDNFAEFDSTAVIGLAYNNFINMSGNGYILKAIDHSNAKLYSNYLLNNTGTSFVRINCNNPIQTIISNNVISNISSGYTFINVVIQYNDGSVSMDNNIFYNLYLEAAKNTYQAFNLIYVEVASSNNSTMTNFRWDNNSYINIQFIKNHALIKQFYNSFIFLSNPEYTLEFQNTILYNISILYDDNLLNIITQTCQFYNNTLALIYNYDSTGSLYFLGKFINITKSNFQYNFAYNGNGGAIYIDFDKIDNPYTDILLVSNIFRYNYALIGASFYYGGGAYIGFNAQNNKFYNGLINSTYSQVNPNNLSPVYGSIAFSSASIQNTLIMNSTTLDSEDDLEKYIFLYFEDIESTNPDASIYISSLSITTNNDTFLAVQIYQSNELQITLDNVSINVGTINYNPIALLLADTGNITISNFHMNLLAGYGPFIELLCDQEANNTISIVNSSISNFLVPALVSSFGIIYISDQEENGECYQTLNLINTTIKNSAIALVPDWTKDFSAIYVDYQGNVTISISQSKFEFIDSIRGPVMNLNNWPTPPDSNNQPTSSTIPSETASNIVNSLGLQNYSNSSFQIILQNTYFAYNVYITINDSEFINNTAFLEGGAIYNTYNNLSIVNSKFAYNQAQYRTGAAIFSLNTNSFTTILNPSSNNTFLANTRYSKKYHGIYSDNAPLGSPPIAMNLTITKTSTSYVNIMNYTNNNTVLITNISSHDLNGLTFTVGLIDILGQIFCESPDGDTELDPSLTNIRMIKIFTNTSSASSSDCDFPNCYISNTSLILKGLAGTQLPIILSYQSNENAVPNLVINSILRSCIVGEINSSQVEGADPNLSICTFCQLNSYSLNLNDSSCNSCSFGISAQCLGGSYLLISPGYWRQNNLSSIIYECPNYFACLGGFNSNCSQGYVGPLCQSCNVTANFARSGANECGLCPGKTQQTLIAFGYMTFIIVYQIYMIRSTLLENMAFYRNGMTPEEEKAKTQGQYIRLLTTYTQIISIVLTFKLEYPLFFKDSVTPVSTPPTNSIFASTLCFLIDLGYDSESIAFYKIGLVSAIPIIKIVIICVILFMILSTCKKKMDPILKKAYYLASIFCVMLVDQPGLFNNLVAYLTCIQLDDDGPYYLLSDYSIQCYTNNYNYYLLLIVLPSILFWGFMIPGGLFIIMFRYRKNLSDQLLRLNLGGIYNEYTDKAYYWGIVLMLTKLLLMLSTAVLYDDTKTEAMTVYVILCIYLIIDGYVKPIKKLEIDKAEQLATASYLITIFFALYYKDNRYAICEIIAIIIIVGVNFFVIGYLIYKIVMLNIKSIPCLKKYALNNEKSPKAKKDEIHENNNAKINNPKINVDKNDYKTDEKTDEKHDLKNNEKNLDDENCGEILFDLGSEIDPEYAVERPNTHRDLDSQPKLTLE